MNSRLNVFLKISALIKNKKAELTVALLLLIGILFPIQAQESMNQKDDGWNSHWNVGAEIDWNNNIFKLSSSQMDRMSLNHPGDSVSGRFKNMSSINDVILSIKPEFKLKTNNGLFNRSLSITGTIDYQHYFENPKRSNIQLGLSFNQKIYNHGTIILQAEYTPSKFVKNYLFEATDSTGRVSSSERIYREAVYNELELILAHRYHFVNWIVDIKSDLFFGFRKRNYNEEFPGRNQDGLTGGLALKIAPVKWCLIDIGYNFESIQSPVSTEIQLLDEQDYQIDFNNDRDFADTNIRTETTVDRSRKVNNLELGLTLKPYKRIEVHIEYKHKSKDYTSKEPIDPNYKDREDKKSKVTLGCNYKLFKDLIFMVEYIYIMQKTNRPEDPDSVGEITDYKTNIIKAGIQWEI